MQKERREAIKELLASKPFVSLEELAEMFPDVSDMTLRRDIEHFEEIGAAIKVRGGCRSTGFISPASDDRVHSRLTENTADKLAIAKAAAEYLEPGRSIFIDSGSTMRALASQVPPKRYSFITTDPLIALELCKGGTSVVNLVGGRLEPDNQTVTGLQATRFLSGVNIDIAFLTPSGYSEDNGFTVGSFNECELKRIVVEKARLVVMLMDPSKLGRSMPYTFCTMTEAGVVVTSGDAVEAMTKAAMINGTEIVAADSEAESSQN